MALPNRYPISVAAGYAFNAATTVPDGWPAALTAKGIHWTHPDFKLPRACPNGDCCSYKDGTKTCVNVHRGEEGFGLHYVPARTYTNKYGKTVQQEAQVRFHGRLAYYERRSSEMRMSWVEWCAYKRRSVPKTSAPVPYVEPKDLYGELLYPVVEGLLHECLDVLVKDDLITSNTTAGKLVGMLLDGCSLACLETALREGGDRPTLQDLLLEGVFTLRETYPAGIPDWVHTSPFLPTLC